MLRCLTEKSDQIKNKACKNEVYYFEKMEVSNFNNDVILAAQCRGDVEKFCKDVEPGAWQHALLYVKVWGPTLSLCSVLVSLPIGSTKWCSKLSQPSAVYLLVSCVCRTGAGCFWSL